MVQVSSALTVIHERFALVPTDLETNERFISFLYQATMLALQNHQQAKLEALKHALIASVGPSEVSEDLSFQFLRYIDELTPTHLTILSKLAVHAARFAEYKSLEQVYSEVQSLLGESLDRSAFRAFLHDLDSRFLLRIGDIHDFPEYQSKQDFMALESSTIRPLEVTPLGHSFLSFVHE